MSDLAYPPWPIVTLELVPFTLSEQQTTPGPSSPLSLHRGYNEKMSAQLFWYRMISGPELMPLVRPTCRSLLRED